jgi:hypothetical protein
METTIDEHVFLREIRDTAMAEGRAEGKAELLREQLRVKFGSLPKWVQGRLSKATPAQVERWARRVLTADTIEGVFGRR